MRQRRARSEPAGILDTTMACLASRALEGRGQSAAICLPRAALKLCQCQGTGA